jgi:mRNA-degrading endonuclease YafQ of YafQ-DinJ toxin-antitoxin module
MKNPIYTNKFKKDLGRCKKRQLELNDIKTILAKLILGETLEPKYRNHTLS